MLVLDGRPIPVVPADSSSSRPDRAGRSRRRAARWGGGRGRGRRRPRPGRSLGGGMRCRRRRPLLAVGGRRAPVAGPALPGRRADGRWAAQRLPGAMGASPAGPGAARAARGVRVARQGLWRLVPRVHRPPRPCGGGGGERHRVAARAPIRGRRELLGLHAAGVGRGPSGLRRTGGTRRGGVDGVGGRGARAWPARVAGRRVQPHRRRRPRPPRALAARAGRARPVPPPRRWPAVQRQRLWQRRGPVAPVRT